MSRGAMSRNIVELNDKSAGEQSKRHCDMPRIFSLRDESQLQTHILFFKQNNHVRQMDLSYL